MQQIQRFHDGVVGRLRKQYGILAIAAMDERNVLVRHHTVNNAFELTPSIAETNDLHIHSYLYEILY
ncbi:hypothetical protein D3C78_1921440 [compost metagenome]